MIVIIGQILLILYSLGVSLSGLLSTHVCLLATVRILLCSSLGSLFELLAGCRITQNVAAMLTGHGKTRAYFHRFKIWENAQCVCQLGDQTIDHLLYI